MVNIKAIGKKLGSNKYISRIMTLFGAAVVDLICFNKSNFYVFSWGGVGDTVAIAALSYKLKEIYGYRKMILVCKDNHKDIACVFPAFDGVKTIGRVFIYFVRIANMSDKKTYGRNYIIGNCRLLFKTWYDYNNRLEAIRTCIHQLPDIVKPQETDISSLKKRFSNTDFDNNTIIIAPTANTLKSLDLETWEGIVAKLNKKYHVLTNTYGNEKPIDGSQAITCSFSEMIVAAEKCKCVISFRSGFSDFLSLNPFVKQIVIYPDEATAKYETVKIYGSKNVYEYVANNDNAIIISQINELVEGI